MSFLSFSTWSQITQPRYVNDVYVMGRSQKSDWFTWSSAGKNHLVCIYPEQCMSGICRYKAQITIHSSSAHVKTCMYFELQLSCSQGSKICDCDKFGVVGANISLIGCKESTFSQMFGATNQRNSPTARQKCYHIGSFWTRTWWYINYAGKHLLRVQVNDGIEWGDSDCRCVI